MMEEQVYVLIIENNPIDARRSRACETANV